MLEQLQAQRDRHDRHRNLFVAETGTGKTVMARRELPERGRRRHVEWLDQVSAAEQ
jgi:hypothetical protein